MECFFFLFIFVVENRKANEWERGWFIQVLIQRLRGRVKFSDMFLHKSHEKESINCLVSIHSKIIALSLKKIFCIKTMLIELETT